jgi:fermentation-respiration switch protein FrsA (DUF1100 family)
LGHAAWIAVAAAAPLWITRSTPMPRCAICRRLKVVDAERVALFGQSMGGSATLYAIDRDSAAQYFGQRFRAAIAYYPRCVVVPVRRLAPELPEISTPLVVSPVGKQPF